MDFSNTSQDNLLNELIFDLMIKFQIKAERRIKKSSVKQFLGMMKQNVNGMGKN